MRLEKKTVESWTLNLFQVLRLAKYLQFYVDNLEKENRSRYLFFKNLSFSRPVQLYQYHQSGSLGALNFIWVVPEEHK